MNPYNLSLNPFPSSPTPTINNANILGGKRHISALNSIHSCLDDLSEKLGNENLHNEDLFKVITMIQDVGSGKTHLTLHMKTLNEFEEKSVISYIDLTQVQPREIDNFFHSIVTGFGKGYYSTVKTRFIEYLRDNYQQNPKLVKKVIKYGFMDSLNGNSISEKLEHLTQKKMNLSYEHLFELMSKDFTKIEMQLITEIIKTSTLNYSDLKTFENLTMVLSTIAKINYKLFNKITIFQIDEFDTNPNSLEYLKGLINSHIPYAILMVVTTPSYYAEISKSSPSLFDRLEKANFKIDLAGSNSFDEINDIALQYVLHYNDKLTALEKKDLSAKIRIIYDEFPEFRNIRSILNVLYHAFEVASAKNSQNIDEQSIEDTIKNVYPGLRLRGSIMGIPISDFIKMRKISIDKDVVEANVRNAVRNLITYFEQLGTVKKYEDIIDGEFLDAAYNDQMGKKVGISIAVDFDKNKNFDKIVKSTKRNSVVDKLVILTTNMTSIKKNGTTLVTIDKWKLADLLYFSKKYDSDEFSSEDPQKALLLAKSIQIC
ncbi:hypothetical protein YTPLAS21_10460 [Candidatus Nitrosocosmicus sp.]|jgi:hypothetical protein|nr:hypothetical protein YTPLAS21_10460 [Candidatus Nitrosocosmicus sp.]